MMQTNKKEAKNPKITQMWGKEYCKILKLMQSSKSEAKNDAKMQKWGKNSKIYQNSQNN